MTHLIINPETLSDAWALYVKHLKEADSDKSYDIIRLTKTALILYTLPGYGLPPEATRDEAIQFMSTIALKLFPDALNIQQNVFDFLRTRKSIQGANRYRVKKMLAWCSAQDWWKLVTKAEPGFYSPRRRNCLGNAHHVKLFTKTKYLRYGLGTLKPHQLTGISKQEAQQMQEQLDRIYSELDDLYKFQTAIQVYKRQDAPIEKSTANTHRIQFSLIFGWLYFYKNEPLEQLGLDRFNDIQVAYAFTEWLREERNVAPGTEIHALVAILSALKFLHHQKSDIRYCQVMCKNYVDIDIIGDMRMLIRDTDRRSKKARPVVDESKKWLNWPEYLACVAYLKKECSSHTSEGRPRSDRTMGLSYQRYLIAALLAYMPPDRQRTFRELEEGKTLVRGSLKNAIFYPEKAGDFYIRLGSQDYKTGKTYGEQFLKIPEKLYPELEAWLNKWRSLVQPQHNFVFTQMNGNPFTCTSLRSLFRHAIYRVSAVLFGEGKATNPHLVRDMLVTHLYEIEASEAVMEGLALGMKHSRETQKKSYDRRTHQEKVNPALDAILKIEPATIALPVLHQIEKSALPNQP